MKKGESSHDYAIHVTSRRVYFVQGLQEGEAGKERQNIDYVTCKLPLTANKGCHMNDEMNLHTFKLTGNSNELI